MSEIKTSTWFNTSRGDVIGIVETVDKTTKNTKFYIGVCTGIDKIFDEELIVKTGAKFFPQNFLEEKKL